MTVSRKDFRMVMALDRGEWEYQGVKAVITLTIDLGGGTSTTREIKSCGLWGIESDSDPGYFQEVYKEQCQELEQILTSIGVTVVD